MKNTNAIEKALKEKCKAEIQEIVNSFIVQIKLKLRDNYNKASFYNLKHPNTEDSRSVHMLGTQELGSQLCKMLEDSHMDSMLSKKSKELIKKLELI